QPVGLKQLMAPETLGAAQQDARSQVVALADRQERVAQEHLARPVALGEIGGELETVLVHSAAPTAWPSVTAANPTTSEPSRLASPTASWSSCPRRWLSSIQVDSVV